MGLLRKGDGPVQACRSALLVNLDQASHAGLVLQRYLSKFDEKGEARQALLNGARQAVARSVGLYEQVYVRYVESLPGERAEVATAGRLVVGLGSASVLETGLCLHHTYGTPYIPGSALKGLASHYASGVWGLGDPEFRREVSEEPDGATRPGRHHEILFGSLRQAGYITFHDAWITPNTLADSLVPDVITVHHPGYYSPQRQVEPPSDLDSPTPVAFLSVRGHFVVAVSCPAGGPEAKGWEKLALRLLVEALQEWGIGAKTSSGYGRLGVVTEDRVATAPPPRPPRVPVDLRPGTSVRVRRVEDPKGKGRLWFELVDGSRNGTVLPGGTPREVGMGEETELIVCSVGKDSVNLAWPDDPRFTPRSRGR